jgi:RimJ/RimL family protein N-acetyltransferase
MRSSIDLADGSRISIRGIEPADREALINAFERLGPESRYQRFFSPVARLTDSQLEYLTNVDHHDHEALVAIDEASGEGIGVARFVRTEAGLAEPAVAVVDDWQGRGVGTMLLDALADRAREEGIHTFAASILADNAVAIAILGRLGETHTAVHGHDVEMLVALEDRPGAVASLHRLLRYAAEQTIRPSLSFWHRFAAGDTRHRDGEDSKASTGRGSG